MTSKQQEKIIRVGSRKSELALIQTKHVIARLQKLCPDKKFEIHTMSTIGDRVLNISLPKIGEKSLFTRDLEDALRNGGVDFVVHSLKDLPTALPIGMAIGAVLEREDPRDALVLRDEYKGKTIDTLPNGAVIGTSSLRRTAIIKRQYPHLIVCDIRGNLNTRLAKLDAPDSKFAGIILAQAGLVRMGWESRISQVLEPTEFLYAVGQGALAVECRANDHDILEILQSLMCLTTSCRILAERSFLKTLGGGCSAPVAVLSKLKGDVLAEHADDKVGLSLTGAVWSLDGKTEIRQKMRCAMLPTEIAEIATIKSGDAASDESSESSNEPSPPKRRRTSTELNDNETARQESPTIINDDAEVESLSTKYGMETLIQKHMDLAMKCPVVGTIATAANHNTNGIEHGKGDVAETATQHCPLHIDVGQDVMGQCPFVSNEAKVSLAKAGKCPITHEIMPHNKQNPADEIDHAMPSTSKCPFVAMHKLNGAHGDADCVNNNKTEVAHVKCPFIQKTVQMFDYADEEKPLPSKLKVLIEDVDNLFCGMFQHACHKRELFVRSHKLGQQLAEQLIQQGALDVMKCAQDEIHGKISN